MLNTDFCNSSTNFEEKGIFKSSIGKWKGLLPNEEVFVAQLIASKLLKEFGYNIYKLKISKAKVLKIISSTPIALIKGVIRDKEILWTSYSIHIKKIAIWIKIKIERKDRVKNYFERKRVNSYKIWKKYVLKVV